VQTAVENQLAREVRVAAEQAQLRAEFVLPAASRGVVILAQASGRSGHSARQRQIAQVLRGRCLGTLLVDLLTPEEHYAERDTRHLRSDIDLLAERVLAAIDWAGAASDARRLPVGVFGANMAAAAVLVASAQRPRQVASVVCRGGRPDLAGDWLDRVRAATLFITGSKEPQLYEPSLRAYERVPGPKSLQSISGAGRAFREPGARAAVAWLTLQWFDSYLAGHWGAAASLQSSML
jgi:putative phosphoribosyl transferase